MSNNLKLYLEDLEKRYDEDIIIVKEDIKQKKLKDVPFVLHELYKMASQISLPFGEIFDIETAIAKSKLNPFSPDWYVFGRDNYFSFWLCSYNKDKEGLSFTDWDHDGGTEIDGAVWEDLVSLLKEIEEEFSITHHDV